MAWDLPGRVKVLCPEVVKAARKVTLVPAHANVRQRCGHDILHKASVVSARAIALGLQVSTVP